MQLWLVNNEGTQHMEEHQSIESDPSKLKLMEVHFSPTAVLVCRYGRNNWLQKA